MTAFNNPGGPTVQDVDFAKQDGLVPAIVQHATTGQVLMVGYQDQAALQETLESGLATFFSRSRGTRWVKGETSGHTLTVRSVHLDCDRDTVLILAEPAGPTCHTGADSCFDEPGAPATSAPSAAPSAHFLAELDALVAARHTERPNGSYTTELFDSGTRRIAQKVGEEGVETALAAVAQEDDDLTGEAADLVYHLLVLLRSRGLGWSDVEQVLRDRHRLPRGR
ncbi:bifunctional phosphoribosyl-AMP cyclohydrolase/phosphoribosyl-ATP diphosphatase HisIE [Ornithinicoccus hortensis]|uniref:Histidine biosynthesis bifunctional protein HisIE n=1 Tax=Ornithinicoccus hortensis TaxID=82346 RepID=A0A542YT71_9MICO|nr:bifunctional phosphoribosyl-AMP cyclohydrolase/phosphoribosyl-ATP diphosphatase HisIE [Ornithinicoccus hortensis]TQL51293.1 phosphoribosyl-ATP pyrophosphatase /phosphoribosyl-AMP cyclohydrolase [Ornithinicoccus hortensis]